MTPQVLVMVSLLAGFAVAIIVVKVASILAQWLEDQF